MSGPPKRTFKAPTIVSPIKEAKDEREYDYEGDMAMSQLRSLIFNAQDLIDMMEDNTNLPEWLQSKITLAEDYVSTAANYLRGELMEAANPAQQAAIAVNMKKKGVKPKHNPYTPGREKQDERFIKAFNKSAKYMSVEEVELQEGRPSQRHPLEGHEYHKKSNAETQDAKNASTNLKLN